MTTEEILALSLSLAGLTEVPADTAIHVPGPSIRRVLAGIDLEGPELLWAKSQGFDLVLTHHPPGGLATLRFWQVLWRHVELMVAYGVPEDVAQAAAAELVREHRSFDQARNYLRLPEFAKKLGIAYMNIHTPLDEIGRRRLVEAVSELSPKDKAEDLLLHLREKFREFRHAATEMKVVLRSSRNPLGKAAVIHGAGTNGGYRVAKALYDHGVDTIILYPHPPPRGLSAGPGVRGKREKT